MTVSEFRYQHLDHLVERVQITLNWIRSVFSRNRLPVRVRRIGIHQFEIRVEEQAILAPWIQRWRFYQRGFDSRLDQVSRRYGLHGLHPADKDTWVVDVGGVPPELIIANECLHGEGAPHCQDTTPVFDTIARAESTRDRIGGFERASAG